MSELTPRERRAANKVREQVARVLLSICGENVNDAIVFIRAAKLNPRPLDSGIVAALDYLFRNPQE